MRCSVLLLAGLWPAQSPNGRSLFGSGGGGCRGASAIRVPVNYQDVSDTMFLLTYDALLAPGAVISLNVSNILRKSDVDVVVVTRRQLTVWMAQGALSPAPPVHGSKIHSNYLVASLRYPLLQSGEPLKVSTAVGSATNEWYAILVVNVLNQELKLEGWIDYVNPGGQHLPLELVGCTTVLWVSTMAFAGLMFVVAVMLLMLRRRQESRLHAILLACLWFKSLELALQWRYIHDLERFGDVPLWRLQASQLCSKMHRVFEILLLLLAALGWRVLRPLPWWELTVTFSAVGVVMVLGLLEVVAETGQDSALLSFKLVAYLVTVMCYLSIVFAININLQLIATHLADSPMSPAIALLYHKQTVYLGIRRAFLATVFRPSVVTWFQVALVPAELWVSEALSQGIAWLIYASLFVALWPGFSRAGVLRIVRESQIAGRNFDRGADIPESPAVVEDGLVAITSEGVGVGADLGGGAAVAEDGVEVSARGGGNSGDLVGSNDSGPSASPLAEVAPPRPVLSTTNASGSTGSRDFDSPHFDYRLLSGGD